MGRTLPSFTQLVNSLPEEWGKFRRALRREDRALLDELFSLARYHSAAAAYAGRADPMEPVLLAICLELLRKVKELESKLKALEGEHEGERLDIRHLPG